MKKMSRKNLIQLRIDIQHKVDDIYNKYYGSDDLPPLSDDDLIRLDKYTNDVLSEVFLLIFKDKR